MSIVVEYEAPDFNFTGFPCDTCVLANGEDPCPEAASCAKLSNYVEQGDWETLGSDLDE